MAKSSEDVLGPRAVMHTMIGDILVRRPVHKNDTHYKAAGWIHSSPVELHLTPEESSWTIPITEVVSIDFDSDTVLQGEEWRHG